MIYTDTRDASVKVDFKTAVMNGMNQETGGLYIPTSYPKLDPSFINKDPTPSFRDIALQMAKPFVEGEIPDDDLAVFLKTFIKNLFFVLNLFFIFSKFSFFC